MPALFPRSWKKFKSRLAGDPSSTREQLWASIPSLRTVDAVFSHIYHAPTPRHRPLPPATEPDAPPTPVPLSRVEVWQDFKNWSAELDTSSWKAVSPDLEPFELAQLGYDTSILAPAEESNAAPSATATPTTTASPPPVHSNEKERSESQKSTNVRQNQTPKSPPPTFTTLPFEIRAQIYRQLIQPQVWSRRELLFGIFDNRTKLTYPVHRLPTSSSRPELALLQVNRESREWMMSRSGGGYACYQRTIVRHPVPTFLIQMGSSETVIEEVRKMAEDAAAAAEAAAANPAAQNQNTTNNPAPAPEPEEAEVYQDAMQPLWLSTKYDIFTDFYTLPLNDESREEWERHLVIQLQPYHHNPHHISQAPRVHLRPYNIYLGWENILALNGRRLDDIITTFCHFASAPLTPAEADTAKYGNLRTIYIGPGRPRESLEPHLVPGVITNNHRNRLGGGIGQDAAAWWRSWGGLRRVRSEERAQAERVIARLIAYNEVVEGMDGERVKFVPVAAPMGKDKGRIEERK